MTKLPSQYLVKDLYFIVSLVVFILNLGGEVISDVTNVSNVVLDHQGDIRWHGQWHLGGQAASLGEHVQIPEIDWIRTHVEIKIDQLN